MENHKQLCWIAAALSAITALLRFLGFISFIASFSSAVSSALWISFYRMILIL
jgi:hypothetical protein